MMPCSVGEVRVTVRRAGVIEALEGPVVGRGSGCQKALLSHVWGEGEGDTPAEKGVELAAYGRRETTVLRTTGTTIYS
jgi:hypothetical protein